MTAKRAQSRRAGKESGAVAATEARWPADAVERRPVAALVPFARNARTHSDEQVAQIAASIREFGWTIPVLVDEAGTIIAGHGRVRAAQSLGLVDIPVMVARGWSDEQRRLYVIFDNKSALNAGWDEDILRLELLDLREGGVDLGLSGFGTIELASLFKTAKGATDPDDVPEVPVVPVSRQGDVWLLGRHRLLCGDSTLRAAVDRLMAGMPADMAFTDPPYNVNYANTASDKLRGTNRPILNDALGGEFGAFMRAALENLLAVTNGGIYICMSSSELDTLQKAFREAGGKWSTFLIWAKNTFTLGRADYQRQYEPMLYGWRDGADRYWCGARNQGDVWLFDKPHKNDLHPTMKPVGLVERAIENSSEAGGVVLDLFGGSGTTMIAAERLGRQARLVELDPRYVDVIVKRWQDFTGEAACRERDGATFADVVQSSSTASEAA